MTFDLVREDKGKGLGVQLRITVPADQLNQQRDSKLKQWAKKVKLDGFRPGKVPMREVRKRFESAAHQECLQQTIQEVLQDAIKQIDVEPITQPKINIASSNIGEVLEFEVKFDQCPEVKLMNFAKSTIKKPVSALTKEAIAEAVVKVREQHRMFEVQDKPAENGDELVIDFKGMLGGEAFEGGSANEHKFVLGEGKMLPDFEQQLLEKRAGDTVEFPMTFPKDYHAKHLAGQSVRFAVKLHTVASGTLPELNEAFFKKLGCDPATQEGFEAEVSKPLQSQLEQQIKMVTKDRVLDLLEDKHKVQLPEQHVEQELARLEKLHAEKHGNGPDVKSQKQLMKQAQKNVTLSFVLREIMQKNEIKLDEMRVESEIRDMALPYVETSVFVQWYKEDEQRMEQLRAQVLEDQVIDWVISQVTIKEEKVPYANVAKMLEKE